MLCCAVQTHLLEDGLQQAGAHNIWKKCDWFNGMTLLWL